MSVTKKKTSRKNKASWRKFVNINDVEDFLEEKRQEERIGSVAEKKDDELFVIDNKSNDNVLTPKQKRKLNALKPPRNLSSLVNTSKVQDPLTQRDRVKLKKNGRDLLEEVLNPKKSQRVLQSQEDRKKYYENLDKKVARKRSDKEFRDVWEEDDDPDKKYFLSNQWINRNMALHNLKSLGKPLVKVHDSAHHKTTLLKSFEPPHPGMSYNPSLKDHQDLINKVIERESNIVKEEVHLKRVTTDMFRKLTADERDSNQLAELSIGIPELQDEQKQENCEENDNNEEGNEYRTVNPPVQNKKKDRKARRKQKEERERVKQVLLKKEQKKKITDIHRLKHLNEEVVQEITSVNEKKKRRKLRKQKKKFEPKRLAKTKFQEPELDVNMAEDIAGNLRNVKTESSLLVDRFKYFQKRNILAPSVDVGTRKRRKIKRFVRSSHKDAEVRVI